MRYPFAVLHGTSEHDRAVDFRIGLKMVLE